MTVRSKIRSNFTIGAVNFDIFLNKKSQHFSVTVTKSWSQPQITSEVRAERCKPAASTCSVRRNGPKFIQIIVRSVLKETQTFDPSQKLIKRKNNVWIFMRWGDVYKVHHFRKQIMFNISRLIKNPEFVWQPPTFLSLLTICCKCFIQAFLWNPRRTWALRNLPLGSWPSAGRPVWTSLLSQWSTFCRGGGTLAFGPVRTPPPTGRKRLRSALWHQQEWVSNNLWGQAPRQLYILRLWIWICFELLVRAWV